MATSVPTRREVEIATRRILKRLKAFVPSSPDDGFDWPWTLTLMEAVFRVDRRHEAETQAFIRRAFGENNFRPAMDSYWKGRRDDLAVASRPAVGAGGLLLHSHLLAACVHFTLSTGWRDPEQKDRAPFLEVAIVAWTLLEMIRSGHKVFAKDIREAATRIGTRSAPVCIGATVSTNTHACVCALASEILARFRFSGLDKLLWGLPPKLREEARARKLVKAWGEACASLNGRLPDTAATKHAMALLQAEAALLTGTNEPRGAEQVALCPVTPAVPPPREPQRVGRSKTMEARDRWIYDRCRRGVPYKKIIADLKKVANRRRWQVVDSIQGIRAAAARYANSHDLPLPPPRQNL